jgi:hypothetical protein
VDLLTNTPPTLVEIRVPRPALGDLVKEFGSETTLYGEELIVDVLDVDHTPATGWRRHIDSVLAIADRTRFQRETWREHDIAP